MLRFGVCFVAHVAHEDQTNDLMANAVLQRAICFE